MKLSDLIADARQGLRSIFESLNGIALETFSIRRLTDRLRELSLETVGIRRSTVIATLGLGVLAIACTGQGATDEPVIPTQALSAEAAEPPWH